MKTTGLSKKVGIIIVIVAAIALSYYYIGNGSSPANSNVVKSDDTGIGQVELSLLNQIKNLNIETRLFKDPAYTSLVDHTVEIIPENVGRANPFAPVPGVPSPFAPTPTPANPASRL